jgi:hypothetical protein
MQPTARPPLTERVDALGRRWWVPGLVWWFFFLGVLVVAVQDCS